MLGSYLQGGGGGVILRGNKDKKISKTFFSV